MPLYIAAKVLGDSDMLLQANGSRGPFQEFQNHYFILQSDIDRPRATGLSVPAVPYTQAMLGMPEWSSDGRSQQERASSDFWGNSFPLLRRVFLIRRWQFRNYADDPARYLEFYANPSFNTG